MSIRHAFQVAIPDDPAAALAGEILPSHWLADHVGDAGDIAFTPAGSIAATNVQAAIEEVAAEAGGGSAPGIAASVVIAECTAPPAKGVGSTPLTWDAFYDQAGNTLGGPTDGPTLAALAAIGLGWAGGFEGQSFEVLTDGIFNLHLDLTPPYSGYTLHDAEYSFGSTGGGGGYIAYGGPSVTVLAGSNVDGAYGMEMTDALVVGNGFDVNLHQGVFGETPIVYATMGLVRVR